MIFSVHPHFQFLISAGLWDVVVVVVEDVEDDDNENNDGDYAVDDGGDHLAPSFHPRKAVTQPRSRLLALL